MPEALILQFDGIGPAEYEAVNAKLGIDMQFGMSLSGLGARHYPEVAAMAEANGFDSVWMPEHLIFPAEMPPKYLYTPDGYPPMPAGRRRRRWRRPAAHARVVAPVRGRSPPGERGRPGPHRRRGTVATSPR